MTIQQIQQKIADTLRDYSDAPSLDAQRILMHILGKKDASFLIAHSNEILSDKNIQTTLEMTEQRRTGMPLAYILGEADFYGRTFSVTQDVLIPRPDTETLIDTALEYIKNNFPNKTELVIADICTGSGCIAITLALELASALPHLTCHIIATDISPAALHIAKQNAQQHGVLDRIEFLEGNMLEPIKNKKVDLIVSNPPYVPTAELASLSLSLHRERTEERVNDVTPIPSFPLSREKESTTDTRGLLFEPQIALDGGPDGLNFVNIIKESGIPAIIETIGGEIITAN